MSYLGRARDAVKRAEAEIRQLAAEAVQVGEYDDVQVLADWARHLSEIHTGLQEDAPSPSTTEKAPAVATTRATYPRFSRDEDSIIKVGWSKKTRDEYEQRAPREVLRVLREQMKKLGAPRRPVTTDRMFPLTNDNGAEIPSYQAYLVLRFLKDLGAVEPHGRRGYTVQLNGQLPAALADTLWSGLPTATRG